MKKGDIVFYQAVPKNTLEKLIALFSHSKEEIIHVAIYVEEDTVIEANLGRTVGYAKLGSSKSKKIVKTCPSLSDEQREKIVTYCLQQFGQQYDLREIGELFLKYFHVDIHYHEKNKKICSTLVNNAYTYAGVTLVGSEDVSPEDLFESALLVEINRL
jgi:uncharacterized protein YycO